MKQKFDQYGFYLFPLVVLVVVVFLFFNNDLPLIEKLAALRRDNSATQERLAALSAKSDLLSGLNKKELESQYRDLNYILPDGKDAPSVLRTIDAAASASGVFLVNLDLTPGALATQSGKQSEIPIKLVVSGTFSQIIVFTGELANLGRAESIKTLDAVFDRNSLVFTSSYELRAFYLSPALSSVPKVDDPLLAISASEKETLSRALKRSLLVPQTILLPSPKIDLFK